MQMVPTSEIDYLVLHYGIWGQLLIFLILAGFAAWNIYLHRYQERQTRLALSNELRKPFFERQFSLVFEAVETVSGLAAMSDDAQWKSKLARFWQLYWGELSIVENRALESAMVSFGQALHRIRQDFTSRAELELYAYQVARAGRDLLEEAWGLGLEPLPLKPQSSLEDEARAAA
jgi:hypothetical protein